MASLFTKIINGEIPCYKIYESENCLAFLDINPNSIGHTLCIPKKEKDYIFDLDSSSYNELFLFSKKIVDLIILYICLVPDFFGIFVFKYVTMSDVSYYTKEGLKKLKDELNQLKDIERPKASNAIAEARDKGDLSENAEYDAAKEAQGMLEMKISKLEEVVANARIIDESQLDLSKVLVLSSVTIINLNNKMEMNYTLVAESEADLKSGKISVNSPIGKGLLGKKVGDVAEIKVPNGILKFEIKSINR